MSGESIYGLLRPEQQRQGGVQDGAGPSHAPQFTGEYEKRLEEPTKPTYSTFWERGKEYDGTNSHFFKQRDAIIGPSVADSVDPSRFLKRGEGVRHVVPPQRKEKIFTKGALDQDGPQRPPFANRDKDVCTDGMEQFEDPSADPSGANARGLDGDGGALPPGIAGAGGSGDGGALPPGIAGTGGDGDGGALPPGIAGTGGNGDGGALPPGIAGTGGAGAIDADGEEMYDGEFAPVPRTVKDFVTSNIVEMSNMVPKRRKDQPQVPTDRKDFGKTPSYLSRVKGEIEQEKTFVRTLEAQREARYAQAYSQYVYHLPESERADLVEKLKGRLATKNATYAKLPITSTSAQTGKRKADLEKDIRDIEEALKKLDRDLIVIYKDDPVNGQWTKNAALEEAKKYAASSIA